MQSLKTITCEKLAEMLPKECLDAMVAREIENRKVYALGSRIFSSKEVAETQAEKEGTYDCAIITILLDEKPGDTLWVSIEESGYETTGTNNFVYFGHFHFVSTTKHVYGENLPIYSHVYERELVDGEWVPKKRRA